MSDYYKKILVVAAVGVSFSALSSIDANAMREEAHVMLHEKAVQKVIVMPTDPMKAYDVMRANEVDKEQLPMSAMERMKKPYFSPYYRYY